MVHAAVRYEAVQCSTVQCNVRIAIWCTVRQLRLLRHTLQRRTIGCSTVRLQCAVQRSVLQHSAVCCVHRSMLQYSAVLVQWGAARSGSTCHVCTEQSNMTFSSPAHPIMYSSRIVEPHCTTLGDGAPLYISASSNLQHRFGLLQSSLQCTSEASIFKQPGATRRQLPLQQLPALVSGLVIPARNPRVDNRVDYALD